MSDQMRRNDQDIKVDDILSTPDISSPRPNPPIEDASGGQQFGSFPVPHEERPPRPEGKRNDKRNDKPRASRRGNRKQEQQNAEYQLMADAGLPVTVLAERETRSKSGGSSINLFLIILLGLAVVVSVWGLGLLREDIDRIDEERMSAEQEQAQRAADLETTLGVLQENANGQATNIAVTVDALATRQAEAVIVVPTEVATEAVTEATSEGAPERPTGGDVTEPDVVTEPATEAPPSFTPTPTNTATSTFTATASPTNTLPPTPTNTPTVEPTNTPTPLLATNTTPNSINIRLYPRSTRTDEIIGVVEVGGCFEIVSQYTNPNESQFPDWIEIVTSDNPLCESPAAEPGVRGWIALGLLPVSPSLDGVPINQIELPE